jgi:hypothetical protein
MAHVDEKTGPVIDYAFVPDPEFVHESTLENFRYTKDDI